MAAPMADRLMHAPATPVGRARAGATLGAAALATAVDVYTPALIAIGCASLIATAAILARVTMPPPASRCA